MPPAKMRGDGRKAKAPKKTFMRLLGYLGIETTVEARGESYLHPGRKAVISAEGVKLARAKAGENGVVLAYGSLYMVGDIENEARKY